MDMFKYYQTRENIHVIDSQDTRRELFPVESIVEILGQIYAEAQGKTTYVLLNLEAHYDLPLRYLLEELRNFYQSIDETQLKVAIVVQPDMINLLEDVGRTMISRKSMHYFTMTARAYLWLNLEHKRELA